MTGPRANLAIAMDGGVRRAATASARVREATAAEHVRKTAGHAMTALREDPAVMAIVDRAQACRVIADHAATARAAVMTAWNAASR